MIGSAIINASLYKSYKKEKCKWTESNYKRQVFLYLQVGEANARLSVLQETKSNCTFV